jgi:hypothetical protein
MDAELTEQSYSAYRGPVMGIKEKGKASVHVRSMRRDRKATQVSVHGSTPSPTAESTMEVSVSGTVVRFIILK